MSGSNQRHTMRTNLLLAFVLGGLGAAAAAGCAKAQTCDDLTARLCADQAAHCAAAAPWVATQHPAGTEADRATADAACAAVLASDPTLAAYTLRFVDSRTPAPAAAAPAAPAAPAARDKTPAEVLEEVGHTAEEAGEALDKIEDALDRKE